MKISRFDSAQGQANRYIKNMGKDPSFSLNGIDVIKLTDKNFLRTLENGIRFGRWVLLENVQASVTQPTRLYPDIFPPPKGGGVGRISKGKHICLHIRDKNKKQKRQMSLRSTPPVHDDHFSSPTTMKRIFGRAGRGRGYYPCPLVLKRKWT